MATYATTAEVAAVLPGVNADDAGLDDLVNRAERDVDGLFGAIRPDPATGLKLRPADLAAWERDALIVVVAAQVEWLLANPRAATDPRRKSVQGPDFREDYADPAGSGLIGPRVALELRRLAHRRVLTAVARA